MYVHLHTHSNFSFLDGASTIESFVAQAAMFQMPALALTDHNTIAGLPQFHKWASVYGIQPISGAEITLLDQTHLTLLAQTKSGYENLCKILTCAHNGMNGRKHPVVAEDDLFEYREGLIVLSGCRCGRISQQILHHHYAAAKTTAVQLQAVFQNRFYLELQGDDMPRTAWLNDQLAQLGAELHIPLVATTNVHYHAKARLPVHDVLRCMQLKCDITVPHPRRPFNHMQWLHDQNEAQRRFARYPSALANTMRIAEQCAVVLELGTARFPTFKLPAGERDATSFLHKLVLAGAQARYGHVRAELQQRLSHELNIIERLGYVEYFLIVWDIVHYARKCGIRCAGRGSAADSAVAYCLYITDVDAAGRGLLFERFMSLERAEKPDIDVDFDSRRRDEVIDYVYQTYGERHVARVATYQTFRGRSAIREVGAALGLPTPLLDTLAKRVPWMTRAHQLTDLFDRVPELQSFTAYKAQLQWLWTLAAEISGFPRHFGMHVGGIVISATPLLQFTSLQPSAKGEKMVPWDKDDVEEVGLIKLDMLSLRTLSAISDTLVLREQSGHALDYDSISFEDTETFEMLNRGDTIGVFQLESPAQKSLQTRLHAESLEDIVASVAIIRPGPIKGNMVDPFIERRHGREPVTYLHPKLEPILGKTYGVILYQEQVIAIATTLANFTPGEADQLRRVMSHARSDMDMTKIGMQFLEKAVQAGVDPDVARAVFACMQGYASYGFCEAHSVAFASTAYKTAYLVRHYPAEFYASILNNYPMGYYPVHVICAEARRRHIEIFGVDINASDYECTVINDRQIRLGFRMMKGFPKDAATQVSLERGEQGLFQSMMDTVQRIPKLDSLTMERLVRVGAFDSLHPKRRKHLLWHLPTCLAQRDVKQRGGKQRGVGDTPLQFASEESETANSVEDDFALPAKLKDEYAILGVGVSGHWMTLFRQNLLAQGYIYADELHAYPDGVTITVAGLLVRPHRPPTKSGKTTVFFTVEDETGFAECTMFESVYHETGAILFTPYGRLIGVQGTVQRRGGSSVQLVVKRVWSLI